MSKNTLTVQHPYQDEECRANLDGFIHTDDRGSPPVFVGRESITNRIQKEVTRCRLNMVEDRSFTRIISGAPGAGKSSLVRERKNQLTNHDDMIGPLTVVSVRWETLASDIDVAKAFIAACRGHDVDPQSETKNTKSMDVDMTLVNADLQNSEAELTLKQQVELDNNPWLAVGRNTAVDTDDVFLLMVDEAQNLSGDNSNYQGRNPVLTTPHDGFQGTRGLKIVPVFVGLSDTRSVLYQRGLSRLGDDAHILLGALSSSETEDLVSKWIRHEPFGLSDISSDPDVAKVSKIIRAASEGWPRHVNTYLKELGSSVLADREEDDMVIDVDALLARGHEERFLYYHERLASANLGKYQDVIYDAAAESSNGIVALEALSTIAENKYEMSEENWEVHHQNAIHAGVFETVIPSSRPQVRFSIPAIHTFAQVRGNRPEFMRKIEDRVATDLAIDGVGYWRRYPLRVCADALLGGAVDGGKYRDSESYLTV